LSTLFLRTLVPMFLKCLHEYRIRGSRDIERGVAPRTRFAGGEETRDAL